jgi:hypothetical protein
MIQLDWSLKLLENRTVGGHPGFTEEAKTFVAPVFKEDIVLFTT